MRKLKICVLVAVSLTALMFAVFSFNGKVQAQEAANSVFVAGYKYTHISSATNTQIKSSAGVLHALTINTATAVGIVTVVDTSASNCSGGTNIAVIAAADTDQTFTFDVLFNNGLCVTTAGASDLTVASR